MEYGFDHKFLRILTNYFHLHTLVRKSIPVINHGDNRRQQRSTHQRNKRDNDNPYTFNDDLYEHRCNPSLGSYYDPNTKECKTPLFPGTDNPSTFVFGEGVAGIVAAAVVAVVAGIVCCCLICILCKVGICF